MPMRLPTGGLRHLLAVLGVVAGVTFLLWSPEPSTGPISVVDEYLPDLGGMERELVAGGWDLDSRERPPQIVFLGNSVVGYNIDTRQFSERTGRRAGKLWAAASASAWWYVALDRIIAETRPRPDLVVLCFRDHYLTYTAFTSGGRLQAQIDAVLGSDAAGAGAPGGGRRDPLRAWLTTHWPVLERRRELQELTQRSIKRTLAMATGQEAETVDGAIERAFARDLLDRGVLTAAQREAEREADRIVYDFDAMLESSFLPEIVASARAHGIELLLVRMPREPEGNALRKHVQPDLARYRARLDEYLEAEGLALMDLSQVPWIRQQDFDDQDHLNADGRRRFTDLLAEELAPHLPPPRA